MTVKHCQNAFFLDQKTPESNSSVFPQLTTQTKPKGFFSVETLFVEKSWVELSRNTFETISLCRNSSRPKNSSISAETFFLGRNQSKCFSSVEYNRNKDSLGRDDENIPIFGRVGGNIPIFGRVGENIPIFGRVGGNIPIFGRVGGNINRKPLPG